MNLMMVFEMFVGISLFLFTVSNALLMSKTTAIV